MPLCHPHAPSPITIPHGAPKTEPQRLGFGFRPNPPPRLAFRERTAPPPPPPPGTCHRPTPKHYPPSPFHTARPKPSHNGSVSSFGPTTSPTPRCVSAQPPPLPSPHTHHRATPTQHPPFPFHAARLKPSHGGLVSGFSPKPPRVSQPHNPAAAAARYMPLRHPHVPCTAAVSYGAPATEPQQLGFGFLALN
jgi:hypothetical protein